jgi:hypothetical protein
MMTVIRQAWLALTLALVAGWLVVAPVSAAATLSVNVQDNAWVGVRCGGAVYLVAQDPKQESQAADSSAQSLMIAQVPPGVPPGPPCLNPPCPPPPCPNPPCPCETPPCGPPCDTPPCPPPCASPPCGPPCDTPPCGPPEG